MPSQFKQLINPWLELPLIKAAITYALWYVSSVKEKSGTYQWRIQDLTLGGGLW